MSASSYPFAHGLPSRDDFATYILTNCAAIRRRAMGKIQASGLTWIDPDDITSSTLRRLDLALLRGLLRPQSERELWAYVLAVTDSVVSRRLARARRDRSLDFDTDGTMTVSEPATHTEAETLHNVLMLLDDNEDRELLFWKLRGRTNRQIASAIGLSEAALRQR
jgi:DNA-directed RNA polymerase specialized sigma24 family protein